MTTYRQGRLRILGAQIAMAWRTNRGTTAQTLALLAAQAVADGVVSLSLRSIINEAVKAPSHAVLAGVIGGLALAVSMAGGRIATNLQMELVEQVRLGLDREVLTLSASLDGLEHLERPEHLDSVMLVRKQSRALAEFGWSVLGTGSLALRVVISLWLLLSVDPPVAGLAVLFVVPMVLARLGRQRVQRVLTQSAEPGRLEQHLHDLCTKAAPGKELRITQSWPELDRRATRLWEQVTTAQLRARLYAAALGAAGWLLFAGGMAAALLLIVNRIRHGHGSIGDMVLVISVVNQLRGQTSGMAAMAGNFVTGMHVIDRYRWLRGYADSKQPGPATAPVPATLHRGIDIDGLGFTYPGTDARVLHDVSLHVPAGSVMALVGEPGAGKTTLIKLLCGFYPATSGHIRIDGAGLEELSRAAWRERTAAAFQDFGRFEFLARETVGVGDLPRIDDEPSVREALGRAQAGDVVAALPQGLGTQLGKSFSGGVELSQGQWQKLALSRAFMRDVPLLLVLDEPTASLDAAAEQALFERYSERARQLARASGTVTLLVSHRFSTVRMADQIAVIADGTIAELGTHEELLRRGGRYATAFRLQASAYDVPPAGHAD